MVPKESFILGWKENSVGKGQNAGRQHFLLFHNDFKAFYIKVIQGLCWKGKTLYQTAKF